MTANRASESLGEKLPVRNGDSARARDSGASLHLAAFSALGQRLSAAQTAKEAAHIIVETADQLLGWDSCWLDLYSPAEDTLTHVLNTDTVDGRRLEFPPRHNRQPPSSLARRAIEEGGQLVLKADLSKMRPEGRPFGNTARPSASMMFVPIRKGAEVIGVLSIQSYTPEAYDQQSLEILQALADHCGGALVRIRAAEALQRRMEQESLVSRLSTGFVHLSPGKTDAAITQALGVVGTFTSADSCCLVYQAPGNRTGCHAHRWGAEGVETCLCAPNNPLARADSWWMRELRRSGAICLPDLAALPFEAGAEKEFFRAAGIKSVVAVPLGCGNSWQGFLRLSSLRREGCWTDEHISLLKIVGEIISNALERKQAAERILRLNQLYSVLSRINELIVRTPPLEALCKQACRIMVESGLFRMAWIGMVEPDGVAVKLVAHGGLDKAFLSRLRLSVAAEVPEGLGPTGTAIREGRYDLCHDAGQDPRLAPWRDLIAQTGYRSIAAFPLKVNGRAVGALTLFQMEPYSFGDEEVSLLEQLSGDLSFAIGVGGQSKQLQLQGAALEAAANSIVITDPDGVITWVNAAFTRLTGYSAAEAVGKKPSILKSGQHDAAFYERLRNTIASGQVWRGELVNKRKDGSRYTEEMTITPVRGDNGAITHYVGIKQEITERKRAEARVAAFSTLGHRLSAAQTAKAAARIIVEVADQLLGWDAYTCDLYSPTENLMTNVLNADIVEGRRTECDSTQERNPPSPTAQRAIAEGGQLLLREQPDGTPPGGRLFGDTGRPSASLMFVPIRNGADVIGVLSIQSYTFNAYNQQSLETLQALADHCGAALDRIQTEEALRSSQARLQLQFDHMPLGCITWDWEHRVTSWNPAAQNIFGYTAAEALGQPAGFLVSDQAKALVEGIGQRLLNGEADTHTVNENHTKDGRTIFCDWTSVPLCGPDGSVVGALSMVQEVTERKRMDAELRWKTAFLEAYVNSSPDGILIVDTQGKKFLQNRRTLELWKIPPEIAAEPDDTKQVQCVMQMTKNPQRFIERINYLYAHPTAVSRDVTELTDGTVLDRYSSPVVGKDGTLYGRIWTFRDITESRRLESQLRQSQKMQAIGQLAGGVAHDFNNLLAVIRGNSELALMSGDPIGEPTTECLKQIVAASDRAAGLTRQLLAFGRKQIMQSQPLNLVEVVANLTKMLKRIIGEDIDLQLRHAGHLPFVQADVGMMEQVLVNLVVNARDAMPKGGQLVISTEPITFHRDNVHEHPEARAGQFVCLSVIDTGTGIAPEHLPHIFEPFYTTKDVGKGTGLGLATVYGIVQQHQGWAEVSSQPGAGSTFRVFLPACEAVAGAAPTEAEPAPRGGTETIFLVEDEEAVRRLTRRMLEKAGYRVLEAASGRKALDSCPEQIAGVDLLLTDVVMPDGISGRDLAEQLRAQRPDLKVIFMTGYSGDELGRDTGFFRRTKSHFLQKPCTRQQLLQTVREALDQK